MAKQIEDDVLYYYDFHPTEEDEMGETSVHARLVRYLMEVLLWLFTGQHCAIYDNLNFYQTSYHKEQPLAPDVAVIKGIDFQEVRSWRVGKTGPAPQVVFEIASVETWQKDLDEKPMKYALMGVHEYFAYDPNDPPLDRNASSRLYGWRFDSTSSEMQKMPLRPDGSLWSFQLDSLLVPDGKYLRLYDHHGHLRLTKAEAKEWQAEAEAKRAEAEKRRADAEAKRTQVLAEKLRSLGVDPDQL